MFIYTFPTYLEARECDQAENKHFIWTLMWILQPPGGQTPDFSKYNPPNKKQQQQQQPEVSTESLKCKSDCSV